MTKLFRKKPMALLLSTMAMVSADIAMSAGVLEEVVVTAQKREQNLQDVSVAVTAFNGDAMRELNMTNSTDIAAQTPGLNIGTPVGEGNNPSISLRGVGLNDFNDNNEGPIAIYRDEVYQSAMPGLTFQLFDLKRVEVLRGPQGTLYGRNATGGLVHFISNKPSEETEGYVDLTLAENNQVKFEAAIGGSLTDNLQARLSVATNDHDGYVKNRFAGGKDANEADSEAYRLLLNWDISDNTSALLNVHGGKSDTVAPQYQHEVTDPSGADYWGYADNDGDNFAGSYDREGVLDIDSKGASLTINSEGENITFTSITAIEDVEKLHQEDTDMGPNPGIVPEFRSKNDQFSQEFRLSGSSDTLNWVTGLFYFENEVEGGLDLTVNYPVELIENITGAPSGTFGTGLAPFFNYDVDYEQETESVGAYGQIEYSLTDELVLIAGLRYTQEERTMEYQNRTDAMPDAVLNSCLIPAGDVCGLVGDTSFPGTNTFLDFTSANPAVGNLDEIDVDNVSGKIGLDYHANDDLLIYGSVSQGFKSGGFNGGFLDFTDGVVESDVPFDEEILTSYEIGVKYTFADGKVRLNASAFYYDYEDYQALTFAGLSQFINNSDATIKGLDLELVWSPTEDWDIMLGSSVLDTEVDSVTVRGVGAVEDSQMVLAPEFTANGLVRYQATEKLSLQVDFSHQDDQFFDITNSAISEEDAYTVFNARIGFQATDNINIAAWVKNLTDEEYRVYTFDFTGPGGFNQQFYAQPRWAGVSAHYSW